MKSDRQQEIDHARFFLASIIDSSQDSIVTVDFNAVITTWNHGAEELYGFPAKEAIGRKLTMLTLPQDLQEVFRKIEKVRRGERVEIYETVRLRKDGRRMHLEVSLSPVKNDAGEVIGCSTIARDVTGKREAEALLRETEEQFRRAIEDAPIPVIMHAEDGQVLQISDTWTALTGYTREEIPTFDAWLNAAYGPGADNVREYVHRLFLGDQRQIEIEMNVRTRTGEVRTWAFSASAPGRLKDGRRFIVGMALDITERRKQQEALAHSQERLRLLMDNARDYAIFSMDLERRVTSWNSGAQIILGHTEDEIRGQSGDLIFTPEDRAAGQPAREARTAMEKGRALDERWHIRKDGTRFWGSGTMMPMRSSGGEAIGFVKIFRDETEKLRAREEAERGRTELREALKEAEEARRDADAANRAKDQFLAMLSHELRTPLMPVLLTAESLLKRPDLSDRVREGLHVIARNVELETRFVNDLLDLTRISRGRLELNREPLDVHAVLSAAVEVCKNDLQAREQKLTFALHAREAEVIGDSERLQQVFWNLLKNASKFSRSQGEIWVTSENEGDSVAVKIRDSGIGIDASHLEKIFEPFCQGDSLIGRKYGGLGLGLAIAKATIDQLGGAIEAFSEGEGRGTEFTVRLPLRNPQRGRA